ncbi:MAG: hydrogenase maturation protease [Candidatus Omnitrophota bacterium]
MDLAVKNRLLAVAGPAALVGIGNTLRGDDAFGPTLVERLRGHVRSVGLWNAGTAPENSIFAVLRSSPRTILFADAADYKATPGQMRFLELREAVSIGFSTHNASLSLLGDLIAAEAPQTLVAALVIQPKVLGLTEDLSPEVSNGLERAFDLIIEWDTKLMQSVDEDDKACGGGSHA